MTTEEKSKQGLLRLAEKRRNVCRGEGHAQEGLIANLHGGMAPWKPGMILHCIGSITA
jgi:hypothetical protein